MRTCSLIFLVAVLINPFSSLEAGESDKAMMLEELNDKEYLSSCFGVDATYFKQFLSRFMSTIKKPAESKKSNKQSRLMVKLNQRIVEALQVEQHIFSADSDKLIFGMNIGAYIQATLKNKSTHIAYENFLANECQLVIEYNDQPIGEGQSVYTVTSIKLKEGKGIRFEKSILTYGNHLIIHSDIIEFP